MKGRKPFEKNGTEQFDAKKNLSECQTSNEREKGKPFEKIWQKRIPVTIQVKGMYLSTRIRAKKV